MDLRRGQATEAEDVGGAAVTSRAGARLEPAVRSQSPRRAGSGPGSLRVIALMKEQAIYLLVITSQMVQCSGSDVLRRVGNK